MITPCLDAYKKVSNCSSFSAHLQTKNNLRTDLIALDLRRASGVHKPDTEFHLARNWLRNDFNF